MFKDTDLIKTFDDTYVGEYENVVVKKIYEEYPKVTYPMIVLEKIGDNYDNNYWDGDKENVKYFAVQIGINAIQDERLSAIDNVERIAYIIEKYMQGDRYKCMRKIGDTPIVPMPTDNNVMVGYLRYNCNIDINTNTIYRRY